MKTKSRQPVTVSFRYEKIMLTVEETTSASRCGSSFADFLRPALVCLYGSCGAGLFYCLNGTSPGSAFRIGQVNGRLRKERHEEARKGSGGRAAYGTVP